MLDLLSHDEALDLFAESLGRTQRADLTAGERAAAERIVTALDRHTLAIKLAGAYAADVHRDLGALARELEDPQQAMALPADETPHAVQQVFASSLDALPPETRRLFVALAAFATEEFGRQAAVAVGASLGLAQPEAGVNLLVLRALLDPSTDETLPEASDRERLRLHPLLRAYAVTQLATWPDTDRDAASEAIARHYAAYIDASTGARPRPRRAQHRWCAGMGACAGPGCADGRALPGHAIVLEPIVGRVVDIERFIPWGIESAQAIAQATGTAGRSPAYCAAGSSVCEHARETG